MQTPQRETVLSSARTVTTHLLREPVKEAVREALHEETATVTGPEADDSGDTHSRPNERSEDASRSSGSSKRAAGVVLLALGGLTYLLRRRMRSESEGSIRPGSRRTDPTGTTGRSTATGPETTGSAAAASDEN